jgi:cysteine synthase
MNRPARYLIKKGLVEGSIPQGAHLVTAISTALPELRRPCRIVTIFPDHGDRYLDLMYDDDWLAERQRISLNAGLTTP